ncbi:phosphoribosyltransferase [Thermosediminibacter oceani]|uniref:Phosphoribosyltransferase n=1 Tax=Thermosediminibacter oceani (strain ATCC BAA-1034 / DSM 16646 / JW/IW-1228P) TaxID=555079 RepID=D9RYG1_THEOJ|nr:phosphoribosyltransferase family protein [Thermosediminibacter oceani]ADL08385.1 phosphoribosyltransferase [Thermosediminibacter oceani DSM 16646]
MFKDRIDAGKRLSRILEKYKNTANAVVFAIPRGGVVVARVVCDYLNLPMDIVVARKIGAPFNEELAIGAVVPGGRVLLNEDAVAILRVSEDYIEKQRLRKIEEIRRRLEMYRGSDAYANLEGKTAIIVDDGIATGYTVKAAVEFVRGLNAGRIIVAAPVIAPDTLRELQDLVDEVVYIYSEEPFYAVGQFYSDFREVQDDEVLVMLKNKRKGE